MNDSVEQGADADAMAFVAGHRSVIAMAGTAARDVLQDTVTADVKALAPGRPVYAALLTPQGKFLVDFFLIDPAGLSGIEASVLIDVVTDEAPALAKRLRMYAIRRDARVLEDSGLQVALGWGSALRVGPALPAGAIMLEDPRDARLGWRLYAPDVAAALAGVGVGATGAGTARTAYDARRVAAEVPETHAELVPNDTFVLEAGLDRLGAVDFRKGCYVGQEVTARMRHKTVLKKKIVSVAVEGTAPIGTPITTAEGKPAGTLFTQSGGRALAHLRLDRIGGPLQAGDATVIADAGTSE